MTPLARLILAVAVAAVIGCLVLMALAEPAGATP